MEKDIVWFDLETTGVNTSSDRIIEICMIKTDAQGNEIGVYHKLVHPGSDKLLISESQKVDFGV